MIEQWKQRATEAIIADLERYAPSEARLETLVRRAFGHDAVLEIRMRSWADTNADAARVLSDIDRTRREYIAQMLVEAGVAPSLATTREEILYWTYLGAALSRGKLTGERLDRLVAEFKRIALSLPTTAPVESPHVGAHRTPLRRWGRPTVQREAISGTSAREIAKAS